MTSNVRITAVLAALGLSCSAGGAQAADCGTINLGAALSATGIYASNGNNTKKGYEFAVKKINDAGGVKIGDKCYDFKITYYDDESTPARAAQLVERLIGQDDIKFVLGPYSSPMTKAILPVTEKYKTPVVQAEAASRSLFTQGYKYHFGIVATSEKYLTPVIDMAAEQAKKAGKDPSSVKVAMIFQDDSFSLDVRQGVADLMKKYNMHAIIDDRMPKDLNDLTAFFTKVKAVKPDVLLISGHEKGAATAARQMGEHHTDVPLIGVTHCESAKVAQDFPKIAEGFVCPTQWDETMKASDPLFGTAMDYNNQIKAVHPEYKAVPYQTAQASVAIYVWKDAFERAGSLDQEKVRQALIKTDMPTFYGHVKFAEDGSNPGKTIVMRQIQDGKFVVVAPPAVAAGPVVYPRAVNY
ncbi:amino acid ABC transporter substrate-binding protein [Bradyrhizobium cenepequi]|uniref:amino acid ABC transporter substrate-binding protein n=1 Tax=Bradyrhizobium cenepequi TaxID=2821403 RepID=UPI001CE3443E|nr:amino acid ABC transporter substrate-binding protein [Bradyrhizobium cenepequi]MCA6108621.1 amino acid ABC transporter substrate-binding protein [Bradyrhizobium cenepequi]